MKADKILSTILDTSPCKFKLTTDSRVIMGLYNISKGTVVAVLHWVIFKKTFKLSTIHYFWHKILKTKYNIGWLWKFNMMYSIHFAFKPRQRILPSVKCESLKDAAQTFWLKTFWFAARVKQKSDWYLIQETLLQVRVTPN